MIKAARVFFSVLEITFQKTMVLKLLKGFLGSSSLVDLQHVETNCLGQGPAFTNGNNIVDGNIPVLKK